MLEVIGNRLAEGDTIGSVAVLGGVGGVPCGLEGQVHGGGGGVFGDPVLADAPPKRMVARARDANFPGQAERVFAQDSLAECVEALLVCLAAGVEV